MIKINGKIKDIEGNIIEDDIQICIEEVNRSFKTSKNLIMSQENFRIELEDGRSGEIIITKQSPPSTETEFRGTGALAIPPRTMTW
jgi:hypothetical protein